MKQEEFKPVQLPANYSSDESWLIGSETESDLGQQGGHRLLTMNMDDRMIYFYEGVSGTDRYPPGRMMHVTLSKAELERAIKIYQDRLARREKEEAEAKKMTTGDDFDPFLDSNRDDLP